MRVGGLQLLFLVNEGGHVVDDAPVGNVLLDLGGLRLFRLQPVDRVSEEEDQDLQKPDPGGNHLLPRESLELLDVGGEEVVAGSKINLLVEEHIAVHELPDLGLVVVDLSQHLLPPPYYHPLPALPLAPSLSLRLLTPLSLLHPFLQEEPRLHAHQRYGEFVIKHTWVGEGVGCLQSGEAAEFLFGQLENPLEGEVLGGTDSIPDHPGEEGGYFLRKFVLLNHLLPGVLLARMLGSLLLLLFPIPLTFLLVH